MPRYLSNLLETSSSPLHPASCPEQGVRPFLKWPGGKRWLAKKLTDLIASRLRRRYFEPFLGGGAVFFALYPHEATLSDINSDLINAYRQVRDYPDAILERLKSIPVTREAYYQIRDEEPEDGLRRAIRLLYLNRTAFGGIYRLNRSGKFNVPYGGGQRTPEPLWRDHLLRSASQCLRGIALVVSDFEAVMDQAAEGDVVYCDPTYTVAHEFDGFIRYNERNFSWEDQQRLVTASRRACDRGAMVVISNASHDSLLALYDPAQPVVLTRKSLVSRKTEGRRDIHEYLFVFEP